MPKKKVLANTILGKTGEYKYISISSVNTALQGNLNQAKDRKKIAFKRLKEIRNELKEATRGQKPALYVPKLKIENAYHDATRSLKQTEEQIEKIANEQGFTTIKSKAGKSFSKKTREKLTLDRKYTGDSDYCEKCDPVDYYKLTNSINEGVLIYNFGKKSPEELEGIKRSIENTKRKIDALPEKRREAIKKSKSAKQKAKEDNKTTKIVSKKEICITVTDKPNIPCPGDPDDYNWVEGSCKDGYWRKKPVKRAKKKQTDKQFDADLLKTIKMLQKALLRYAGTIDPKSLADAGKPIQGVKIIHASGARNKYKHPSGIGKRSGYTIQYACVNLHDLITSHNPFKNFSPDKRFPSKIQDRDYTKTAEKNKVIDIALKMQPEYMLSQAVTAAEGTPIVTHDMIVLSGNGRVQALKYASEHSPVNYEKYKLEAIESAPRFAILRDEIKQFEKPVIVRFVNINARTQEAINFGHAANSKVGAERSEIREAAHIAEILPPEMLNLIKDADDTTLSGILDQKEFREFFKNQIPVKDWQKYFKDTGKMTESGKIFVKKVLLIKCLGSPETLENMTEQHLLMFTNALPALVEVRQLESSGQIKSEYSITGIVSESLRFLNEEIIKAGYKNYEDFKTQRSFLEKKTASKEISTFLQILDDIERKGKLLTFYLVALAKDATAESNLSSGMFQEVKELPFHKILADAFPKAENSYKLYKQTGVKDNLTPVMFGEIADDNILDEIIHYAKTINSKLAGMSKAEHLKQSRKASKQGNVALALKHLSSALRGNYVNISDPEMKKIRVELLKRINKVKTEAKNYEKTGREILKTAKYLGRIEEIYAKAPEKIKKAHIFYEKNLKVKGQKVAGCQRGFGITISEYGVQGKGSSGSLEETFIHEMEHLLDRERYKEMSEFTPRIRQMLREIEKQNKKELNKFVSRQGRTHAKNYIENWFERHAGHNLNEEETDYAIECLLEKALKKIYKTKSAEPKELRKILQLGDTDMKLREITTKTVTRPRKSSKVATTTKKKPVKKIEAGMKIRKGYKGKTTTEQSVQKPFAKERLKKSKKLSGNTKSAKCTKLGDFDFIPKIKMTASANKDVNAIAKQAEGLSITAIAEKFMKNMQNAGKAFRAIRANDGHGKGQGRRPHAVCIRDLKVEFTDPKDAEKFAKDHLFRALAAKKLLQEKAPENATLLKLQGYLEVEKTK